MAEICWWGCEGWSQFHVFRAKLLKNAIALSFECVNNNKQANVAPLAIPFHPLPAVDKEMHSLFYISIKLISILKLRCFKK